MLNSSITDVNKRYLATIKKGIYKAHKTTDNKTVTEENQ